MRVVTMLVAGALGVAMSGAAMAQAPTGLGCRMEREDHYVCNRQAFAAKFAAIQTVQVQTARMDVYGDKEMAKVLEGMGKTIASADAKPDLVVELSWIDRSGRIDFGPEDISLAFLRAYVPDTATGKRLMVWSETWDGQDERPWPAIVADLTSDFKTAVAAKH